MSTAYRCVGTIATEPPARRSAVTRAVPLWYRVIRMNARVCGLILGAVVAILASVASAQARVSVGPFTGSHAEDAERVVAGAIARHAGELSWVSDAAFAASAARIGVAGLAGDEDIARVGRDLQLDVVVVGELQRRGRRDWVLRVRVLRGRDGSTLGTGSWEMHSIGEMALLQAEIWEQLHGYISVDPAPVEIASPPPVSVPPPVAGSSASTPGLAPATLAVSAGLAARSWRIPVLGDLSPRGYENSGFAEGAAEVQLLYRWAQDRAGVGISGGVVFPISLASRGMDTLGNTVSLSTSMIEGWGGLAMAYRPPSGGLFRFDAGMVFHSFTIDTAALPLEQQLAPVSYTGLRLTSEGIVPLYATENWEFGALFAAQLRVVSIGSDVRAAFGEHPGTTLGIAGTAGLQIRLDGLTPGLALRLAAEFLRYRTAFAGPADVGTGSDSVDDYVRVHLGLSYGILTPRARH